MHRQRDPKLPTRKVMEVLHGQLRTLIAQDEVLVRRLREILAVEKGWLLRWLALHQEVIRQAGAPGDKQVVSPAFRDWFRDYANGIGPSRTNPISNPLDVDRDEWPRIDVIAAIAAVANDPQPSDADLKMLLASGLSLVFMRRNEGVQDSYYHHLLADLMASELRRDIETTLRVPPGRGTVGWIAKRAQVLSRRYRGSLRTRPQAVAIPTCFADPRGRVASEDLLTGNRSFIAVPIFGRDARDEVAVGLVFAFFPVDGLFLLSSSAPSPFVSEVNSIVNDTRVALLGAMDTEAWANTNTNANSDTTPAGVDELDAVLNLVIPAEPNPDDPIGSIIAWVAQNKEREHVDIRFRVREQAVVERMLAEALLQTMYREWQSKQLRAFSEYVRAENQDRERVWEIPGVSSRLMVPEVGVLLVAHGKPRAVLTIHCVGGRNNMEKTLLWAVLDREASDQGSLAVLANVLAAFEGVEEAYLTIDDGKPSENVRSVDDLRHLLFGEILADIVNALQGKLVDPATRRSTDLATQLMVDKNNDSTKSQNQTTILQDQIKLAKDATRRFADAVRACFDETEAGVASVSALDIPLASLWRVGPRWVITGGSPTSIDNIRDVLEGTDAGFQQVLSFLLEYAPTLGPRQDTQDEWLFDQSDYQLTYVSSPKRLAYAGGAPVLLPPIFFPAPDGGEAAGAAVLIKAVRSNKESRGVIKEAWKTRRARVELWRDAQEAFSVSDWQREDDSLFPMAFHAIRGCLSRALVPERTDLSWSQVLASLGSSGGPASGEVGGLLRWLTRLDAEPHVVHLSADAASGRPTALMTVYRPSDGGPYDAEKAEGSISTWRSIVDRSSEVYRKAQDAVRAHSIERERRRLSELAHFRHLFRHETKHVVHAVQELSDRVGETPQTQAVGMATRSLATLVEFVVTRTLRADLQYYDWPTTCGGMLRAIVQARSTPSHWSNIHVDIEPDAENVPIIGLTSFRESRYGAADGSTPRHVWVFLLCSNLFDNAFEKYKRVLHISARLAQGGMVEMSIENDGRVWSHGAGVAAWIRGERQDDPSRPLRSGNTSARGRDTVWEAVRALNLSGYSVTSPRPGHQDGVRVTFLLQPRGSAE